MSAHYDRLYDMDNITAVALDAVDWLNLLREQTMREPRFELGCLSAPDPKSDPDPAVASLTECAPGLHQARSGSSDTSSTTDSATCGRDGGRTRNPMGHVEGTARALSSHSQTDPLVCALPERPMIEEQLFSGGPGMRARPLDAPSTVPRATNGASLTVGSLFSGIGGLELGLEWAGLGPVLFQVEKDEYCRAVLAKHWPDATRYEDVRDVGRANLVPVDVICGGFPCQDISVAGNKAGLDGERSGLWFEFARIIREVRPAYVVVENVPRLLADGMGRVLGELAACGYDATWDCVPASTVGAPHIRDRVFIVGYRSPALVGGPGGEWRLLADAAQCGQWTDCDDAHGPEEQDGLSDAERSGEDVADSDRLRELQPQGCVTDERRRTRDRGQTLPDANSPRLAERNGRDDGSAHGPRSGRDAAVGRDWWDAEPDVGRVAHGVPARVDRLRALGNAVVPQVAEIVGRVVLALDAQRLGGAA